MHAIVAGRLLQAVYWINRKYKIPKKNRLRTGPAFEIMERFLHLRNTGAGYHSAQVMAAAAQKSLGPSRKALYRKVISLYGWWTRKAMLKRKAETPVEFRGRLGHRVGGTIVRTYHPKTGQIRFIA